MSNTDRLNLLLEWWDASRHEQFAQLIWKLASAPIDGLDSWRDGEESVQLLGRLRDGYFSDLPRASEIASKLEDAIVEMMDIIMPWDELENISDAVEEWKSTVGNRVIQEVEGAIRRQVEDVDHGFVDIDSDSTLNEHLETVEKLGQRAAIDKSDLESAKISILERIAEVESRAAISESPGFDKLIENDADRFDDVELNNLFAPLISDE